MCSSDLMADIKYYDVILKPVITERSMAGMGNKEYTFLVHPEANKTMIKEAVQKMFDGVKVERVNTMNYDGKKKRRGMTELQVRTCNGFDEQRLCYQKSLQQYFLILLIHRKQLNSSTINEMIL